LLGVKVYPSIKEIPGKVDLALLTVPRSAVPELIKDCAEKGVRGVILYSGGFSESGPEGKKVDTHGQSPWHFTVQASLDLNPAVIAISHTQ